MYKLVALFALMAVCAAAPAPKPQWLAYSSPVVAAPIAPVVPAVTSYSAYSSSIVHPAPVVPVVHSAPIYHAAAPVVHSVPLTYSSYII